MFKIHRKILIEFETRNFNTQEKTLVEWQTIRKVFYSENQKQKFRTVNIIIQIHCKILIESFCIKVQIIGHRIPVDKITQTRVGYERISSGQQYQSEGQISIVYQEVELILNIYIDFLNFICMCIHYCQQSNSYSNIVS